jgi:glycosyltransferase involved in cell wall biosynthesis
MSTTPDAAKGTTRNPASGFRRSRPAPRHPEGLGADDLRVYVHLYRGVYNGIDVETCRLNYQAGKEPDETPYGFHLATEDGFKVTFSRDHTVTHASPLPDRILNKVLRWLTGKLNFDVAHAYWNRDQIRGADAIWTITEGEAFAIALLCAAGVVPRRPLIGNAIFFLNEWDRLPAYRKTIYRCLSRYIDVMTVHSRDCLPIMSAELPHSASSLVYFGINTELFRITTPLPRIHGGPLRIFAPGNDRTRDWDTLLAAFGNDDRFQLTILSTRFNYSRLRDYNNVITVSSPTMADFIRCYREADVVTVVARKNIYAGITVALEAAALGAPILASRTGGVPTYFDEDDLFYAPVGDPQALRDIVLSSDPDSRSQRAQRAQERFRDVDYSTRGLIGRYIALTRELL